METFEIEANGFVFECDGAGEGELVLLLHGFPESSHSYRHQIESLASAGFRAVAPNQRGYSPGARPAEVAAYDMREITGDAVAVIGALGFEQAHVVGHDWGGAVAWHLAARNPEIVASLAVLATPHPLALGQAIAADEEQRNKSTYIQFFRQEGVAEEALSANGYAALRAIFTTTAPEETFSDADLDALVDRLAEPGALTAALNWYRAISFEAVQDLPDVTVPTMLIWGSLDVALGRAAVEASGQFVRAPYELVVLEGASHWLTYELPARISQLLLDHVRRWSKT